MGQIRIKQQSLLLKGLYITIKNPIRATKCEEPPVPYNKIFWQRRRKEYLHTKTKKSSIHGDYCLNGNGDLKQSLTMTNKIHSI